MRCHGFATEWLARCLAFSSLVDRPIPWPDSGDMGWLALDYMSQGVRLVLSLLLVDSTYGVLCADLTIPSKIRVSISVTSIHFRGI